MWKYSDCPKTSFLQQMNGENRTEETKVAFSQQKLKQKRKKKNYELRKKKLPRGITGMINDL